MCQGMSNMLDRYQEVAQAAGTWGKALWLVDFYGKAEKTYGEIYISTWEIYGKSMGNLYFYSYGCYGHKNSLYPLVMTST